MPVSTIPPVSATTARAPVTIPQLLALKAAGTPIVMVTAYDYPSGTAAEAAGVDMVLVGDSGAQTVLGYPDTVSVTVEEMLVLAAAARRAVRTPLLVVDLPFGSYEVSDEQAVTTAIRLVKAGADAVKLEGGGPMAVSRATAVAAAGIAVMGHVGLTPQTAVALGGLRAQGRTAESALRVVRGALDLQRAGCFAVVFEAVPTAVTAAVMPSLQIPVIGIGAGPGTDGQVLVFHDLLGISAGRAKFVRRYAEVGRQMTDGISAYAEDVRTGRYPAPEHGYGLPDAELAEFRSAFHAGT